MTHIGGGSACMQCREKNLLGQKSVTPSIYSLERTKSVRETPLFPACQPLLATVRVFVPESFVTHFFDITFERDLS